jgi:Lhr-like helicase
MGSVSVEPHAGRPTVPQWSSHLRGIPASLAREIHVLRNGVADRLRAGGPQAALAWLRERYALEGVECAHAVRYVAQQMAISAVPSPHRPVIEIYRMDRRQAAVFHTGAGRRVNETLARAAAARVHVQSGANTQIATDDEGFMLTLPAGKTLPDTVWGSLLRAERFDRDLLAGLRSSHLLHAQFRHVANVGLLVLRRAGGRVLRRRLAARAGREIFDRIYSADPSFPLVRETFRTVTRDLLDVPGAREYLAGIEGEPRVLHPPAASPFTFGILTSSFGDAVVMDDRAAMVEALHERVLAVLAERAEAS